MKAKFVATIMTISLIIGVGACAPVPTTSTADAVNKSVVVTNDSTNLNDEHLDKWFTYMNRCQVKTPSGFVISGRLDSWSMHSGCDTAIYGSLIEVVIDGVPYITSIENVVMWYEVDEK